MGRMNKTAMHAPDSGWAHGLSGGTHVSWDTITGALLPTGLAVLLVIGAIAGSHLTPAVRRRAERFVSYPLLMGLLGGETAWSLWTHDSVRALMFGVPFILYGALRKPLLDKPAAGAPSVEPPRRELQLDRLEERTAFDRRAG
jgi:hypothetical protein